VIDVDGRWWWEFGQACVMAFACLAAALQWPRYRDQSRRVWSAYEIADHANRKAFSHEERLLVLEDRVLFLEAWREERERAFGAEVQEMLRDWQMANPTGEVLRGAAEERSCSS
jgi:hypothetical protein